MVEFLTTGVLKFKKEAAIDVFLVGGGSSGGAGENKGNTSGGYGGGGGAGGYTKTLLNIIPRANTEYPIVIGNGGAPVAPAASGGSSGVKGQAGGTTSAFGATAEGGKAGSSYMAGAAGGSGGGGGKSTSSTDAQGNGGSDGSNGTQAQGGAGTGQGTTTREFGETTGKLYAGGGGGGGGGVAISSTNGGKGRDGGGNGGRAANGEDATANTGSGGGGAPSGYYKSFSSGAGGSGIVCIRLHKESEVPELAGTWTLNTVLNPAANTINETVAFFATTPGGSFNGVKIGVGSTGTTTATFYLNASTIYTTYQFSNNSWVDSSRKITQITFATGATASDEFMTWLVANATKTS